MAKTPLDQLGKVDGNVFGAVDVLALTDAGVHFGPTADRPTGSRRHDGKLYFDTTTRQLLMWDATAAVWSIAAQHVWNTWTQALTSTGTSPNLGTAPVVINGFTQLGKTVHWHGYMAAGGTGVAAGTGFYRYLLPVAPSNGWVVGHGMITWMSAGGGMIPCQVRHVSGGLCELLAPSPVGGGIPQVDGAGWNINLSGTYQAA